MVVGRVKVKNGQDADIVVGDHDNATIVPHGNTSAGPSGTGSYASGAQGSSSGPGLLNYGGNQAPPPAYGSGAPGDTFNTGVPIARNQSLPDGQYPPEKGQYR